MNLQGLINVPLSFNRACVFLWCVVCDQPLTAGDSKPAGVCVASRPLRTQRILGRGRGDLWLRGARRPNRGVVRPAAKGGTWNQLFVILSHKRRQSKYAVFIYKGGGQHRGHNAVQGRIDCRVEVHTCREEPHAASGPSPRYILCS